MATQVNTIETGNGAAVGLTLTAQYNTLDYPEAIITGGGGGSTTTTYYNGGWDSANGNYVVWTSTTTPNATPSSTTPALVGTLLLPHWYTSITI